MTEKKRVRITDRQRSMLDALSASMGNVSVAAEKSNTDRTSHYVWMKNNPKYAEEYELILEKNIDLAEGKLLININKGDQRAVEYFLDRQGSRRGYGKKVAVTGDSSNPVQVNITTPEAIEEARQKYRESKFKPKKNDE